MASMTTSMTISPGAAALCAACGALALLGIQRLTSTGTLKGREEPKGEEGEEGRVPAHVLPPTPSGKYLCVYLGSRPGASPAYAAAAKQLGESLARRGVGLVYGGGNVGLMGVLAHAVDDANGVVVGVIPRKLLPREISGVTVQSHHLIVTENMHERKWTMAKAASAFLALPGGFGTLEEVLEAITWSQLRIHDKRVGVLNVNGFWSPLVGLIHSCVNEGFVSAESAQIAIVESDVERLLDRVLAGPEPSGAEAASGTESSKSGLLLRKQLSTAVEGPG